MVFHCRLSTLSYLFRLLRLPLCLRSHLCDCIQEPASDHSSSPLAVTIAFRCSGLHLYRSFPLGAFLALVPLSFLNSFYPVFRTYQPNVCNTIGDSEIPDESRCPGRAPGGLVEGCEVRCGARAMSFELRPLCEEILQDGDQEGRRPPIGRSRY